LVRFAAGKDNRKTGITEWIRLEEHSVAIATDIVHGLFPASSKVKDDATSPSSQRQKQNHQQGWVPTKLWLRSSRELVMAMHVLDEKLGQIRYRLERYREHQPSRRHAVNADTASSTPVSSPSEERKIEKINWVLGERLGRKEYKLLNVATEIRGCTSFATLIGSSSATASNHTNNHATHIDSRERQIIKALEEAERAEQRRVRQWTNEIPLLNKYHPKALTCQDESALDPLGSSLNKTKTKESFIRPTPLIRKGLDRMYILDQLVPLWESTGCETNDNDSSHRLRSKDVALSLSLTLFDNDSVTACIAKQNGRDRGDVQQKHQPQGDEGRRRREEQQMSSNAKDNPAAASTSVPSKSDDTHMATASLPPSKSNNTHTAAASMPVAKSDNIHASAPALAQPKSDHAPITVAPTSTSSRTGNIPAPAGITTTVAPAAPMVQNTPSLAAALSSLAVRFDAPGPQIQPPGGYYNPALRPFYASSVATQPPPYYGQRPPPGSSYPSGAPQQPQNTYFHLPPNPYNGQQYPPNPHWRFG
jgi:hypothetical protein